MSTRETCVCRRLQTAPSVRRRRRRRRRGFPGSGPKIGFGKYAHGAIARGRRAGRSGTRGSGGGGDLAGRREDGCWIGERDGGVCESRARTPSRGDEPSRRDPRADRLEREGRSADARGGGGGRGGGGVETRATRDGGVGIGPARGVAAERRSCRRKVCDVRERRFARPAGRRVRAEYVFIALQFRRLVCIDY